MTLTFDSQIAERLDHAERNVRCLFPRSRNDSRRLVTRTRNGSVVRVQTGYFARPTYWNGLDVRQRFAHVLRAAAEQHPHSVFVGFAAAYILGLDLSGDRLMRVRKKDCVPAATYPGHIYLHGYRISPLHETLFDCMVALDFSESLALIDSALRGYSGLGKELLLKHFHTRGARSRGFQRAIKALTHGDGSCPHPDLSYARARIYEQGFTMPRIDGAGAADFCWSRSDGTALCANLIGHSERYEHVAAVNRSKAASHSLNANILRLTPELIDDAARLTQVLARANVPRRD